MEESSQLNELEGLCVNTPHQRVFIMSTEALRTKVDGLQWELNRLDPENKKLRAENT